MVRRMEHALLVGIDNYSAYDGVPDGAMALKRAVSDVYATGAALHLAGLPPGRAAYRTNAAATRANILSEFGKLVASVRVAGPERARGFFGFAGRGGWDPLRGPFLAPSDLTPAKPERRIFLDELAAIADAEIPDDGLTVWLGCCLTARGAPVADPVRIRTITPAAPVPAAFPRMRRVDRVIGVATDAAWRDDAGPYDPSRASVFGQAVEVHGSTTDFRGYDIEDGMGTNIGEMCATGPSYSGSTNLSAGSEHWHWSGASVFPNVFRLVPNGSTDHSIGTPFARYAHQAFPTTNSDMAAISAAPKAWQLKRGPVGGALTALDVVFTRSGSTYETNWYALAGALTSARFVACASTEVLEFSLITSNPASLQGPPGATQIRRITAAKL